MSTRMRTCNLFVFDGQSLFTVQTTTAPEEIIDGLTLRRVGFNEAVAGSVYVQRIPTAPARVDSLLDHACGTKVYVDCGGTTDIIQGSFTAQDIIDDMEQMWSERLSAGWDLVVAGTVVTTGVYTGPEQTKRAAVNVGVLASSVPDAIADIAAAPQLSDPTNMTYFEFDQIHPTPAGVTVIADTYIAALATLGIT